MKKMTDIDKLIDSQFKNIDLDIEAGTKDNNLKKIKIPVEHNS